MRLAGFLLAAAFMTRLPIAVRRSGAGAGAMTADLADAAPWLPAVGALIGGLVALTSLATGWIGPWVGALFGLIAWVAVTGALHLDGLGDSADAAGAAHGDPERYVAVLKDPNAGNFAIVAIVLQLLAKLVLLHAVTGQGWAGLLAIVLVAAWARWGVLVWARALEPLTDGLAARLRRGINWPVIAANLAMLMVVSLLVAPLLILAPLAVAAILWLWRRGPVAINGDGLGACLELTETLLLVVVLASIRLGLTWF